MDKQLKSQMLQALTQLAGKQVDEEDILRQGTQIVLPETMSVAKGIEALQKYQEAQEREQNYSHRFNARSFDGLVAMKRALKRLTGMTQSGLPVQTLFGTYIPPTLSIQIGVNEWEDAPTGEIPVEIFEGTVSANSWYHEDLGYMFQLDVTAPRKYTNAIEGFFSLIEDELENNSIYRGKAFTADDTPDFLDLNGVDPEKVVYSQEVLTQLDANVWSLLQHSDAMRENGLPLKRSVLLHGPYGTGKTLAAYLTAQRAIKNGWTFIFVRPGKDKLSEAIATARLYQPSVVFFEDVDITSNPETDVSHLLDVFDGIQAKGTELVAVMTTNHPERIHKGLVRPGRLDAVIEIGTLDTEGIERLIRSTVEDDLLPLELDMPSIAMAMTDFMPAFVKEAIDRAIRYSIARNEGMVGSLTSDDFVNAAQGLRPQLEMMNGAADTVVRPPLESTIASLVRNELDSTRLGRASVFEPVPEGNTV